MMLGLSGAVMAAGGRNQHFDGSISREVLTRAALSTLAGEKSNFL